MSKIVFKIAVFLLPVSGFCQEFSADSIVCDCIIYSDWSDSKSYKHTYNVSLEELNAVPPPSETRVNYVSDYELEKDSLGRVSKLIRSYSMQKEAKEIAYIYDAQNRLIQENIHSESNSSGNYTYREEKVHYTYDDFGRKSSKTTKVVNMENESVIEECHYIYNSKE